MPTVETDSGEDRTPEELEAIVKSHVMRLHEHFDSVQIICTKGHENGTYVVPWGAGNWFARYGSTREWVLKLEEGMRNEVRGQE